MITVISSKAGHEHDEFHNFVMDFDSMIQPKLKDGEYLFLSEHHYHVVRRDTLTKEQYLQELYERKADRAFILLVDVNNEGHIDLYPQRRTSHMYRKYYGVLDLVRKDATR